MISLKMSFFTAIGFISFNTLAADLYVSVAGNDSNAGISVDAPFRTIQRAADMAFPGATIEVSAGTYREEIVSRISGIGSAPIVFVSKPKGKAIITPVAHSETIWKVEGGYTDIIGFEIDGTGNTTVRQGIYLTGGNSNVKNTLIHHIAQNSGCDSGGGAAIVADQNRGANFGNYNFIRNIVHNIGTPSCKFIQGIYHSSTGSIKNNLIYAVGAYGIHLWHDVHNVAIVNNTVFGCGNGIVYGGADQITYSGPADNIRIFNNIIYDNTGTGISENSKYGPNNLIRNNLVFKNGTNYNLSNVTSENRTDEIEADPQFVNYIREGDGDYHLQSTSPAINAGTETLVPNIDLDRVAVPKEGPIDLGVYQFKN